MNDKFVVRSVVVFLGIITLVALTGGIWLADHGKGAPDFIVATIAGGLGAMSALLAKTALDVMVNRNGQPVMPVVIDQPANDPVPVDTTPTVTPTVTPTTTPVTGGAVPEEPEVLP